MSRIICMVAGLAALTGGCALLGDPDDGGLYVMVEPNAQGYSGPPARRIYKIYPRPQN